MHKSVQDYFLKQKDVFRDWFTIYTIKFEFLES